MFYKVEHQKKTLTLQIYIIYIEKQELSKKYTPKIKIEHDFN
jgi:hypothetical protein